MRLGKMLRRCRAVEKRSRHRRALPRASGKCSGAAVPSISGAGTGGALPCASGKCCGAEREYEDRE